MRCLIQRVSEARVDIAGETVGQIGKGLMILVCAMGGDEDAFLFLRLLHENKEATVVVEAAAVALGILPPDLEPRATDSMPQIITMIQYWLP